jgi:hypothetical protein
VLDYRQRVPGRLHSIVVMDEPEGLLEVVQIVLDGVCRALSRPLS